MKAPNISTGTGKTIVELCSALKIFRFYGGHKILAPVFFITNISKTENKERYVRNAVESLQVSELKCHRIGLDDVSGFFQSAGGLLLSLGRDDLGSGFASRLGLGCHGSGQLLRQTDVLHLDTLYLKQPDKVKLTTDSRQ